MRLPSLSDPEVGLGLGLGGAGAGAGGGLELREIRLRKEAMAWPPRALHGSLSTNIFRKGLEASVVDVR